MAKKDSLKLDGRTLRFLGSTCESRIIMGAPLRKSITVFTIKPGPGQSFRKEHDHCAATFHRAAPGQLRHAHNGLEFIGTAVAVFDEPGEIISELVTANGI